MGISFEKVDPEAGGYRFTTNERLLILFPNGQFAAISCTVEQTDDTGKAMLIPNGGFGVYKGTWKRNDDNTITVTSRLVSSNKLSDAGIEEGHKETVELLVIRTLASDRLAQRFELNGRAFVAAPKIEGILELLAAPAGDD